MLFRLFQQLLQPRRWEAAKMRVLSPEASGALRFCAANKAQTAAAVWADEKRLESSAY
jgi:hypothetical protein